ncbi:MAG: hypothetical protein KF893_04635 [Caldilineaceae bacterium]|nr:hypothetical protein [Caldilineaceae bacterium]
MREFHEDVQWHIVGLLDEHALQRAYPAVDAALAALDTDAARGNATEAITAVLVQVAEDAFRFGVEFGQNPIPYLLADDEPVQRA